MIWEARQFLMNNRDKSMIGQRQTLIHFRRWFKVRDCTGEFSPRKDRKQYGKHMKAPTIKLRFL